MSSHDHAGHHGGQAGTTNVPWRTMLVLLGFLAIGGALLWTEHRAHVLDALIWLPLAACVLMHLFMHGGHGHGGHDHAGRDRSRS